MTARLITIPFSHYCEKARWALDRCGVTYDEDGHLPLFHYLATRRARAGRTVPVVVTSEGDVLADSTEIVAWADAHRPGTLLPDDPVMRADALALEDELDVQLGPATRRWAYGALLPVRAAQRMFTANVPRWESLALRATRPLAFRFLRKGLAITPEGIERSRKKIADVFERIERRLADGRRYLAGDRFTVADLTFASLVTPIVLPPEHPKMHGASVDLLPADSRSEMLAWRASIPGQYALRVYAEHRSA